MRALPEGTANAKHTGGRIGYRKGGFNAAIAIGRQPLVGTDARYKVFNAGASYDFGVMRLMGQYHHETLPTAPSPTENRYLLGVIVPIGLGDFRASYIRSELHNSPNDATQLSLGYVYYLSKRTALYGTFAQISNDGAARFAVTGGASPGGAGNASPGGPIPGGKSRGAEFGVRHLF
jgi:predicted porin